MTKLKNIIGHVKTIHTHRKWVRHYCFMAGLYKQGLLHDLSKYSPTEFIESIKYYSGTGSPIDACKKDKGWSKAWMHHKGRNMHHYEFWQDNFDNGGVALLMPYKYNLELICDFLGAAKTYLGDEFSYESEYNWWLKRKEKPLAMHEANKNFISKMLELLKYCKTEAEIKVLLKNHSWYIYNDCVMNHKAKGTNS